MPQVTIVSNRLPISVKKTGGKLEFYPSSGGLATGLSSYTKNKNNKWVGWPGLVSEDLTDRDMDEISRELARHNCYPVFLSQEQIDKYYNGYSNGVLWPFFHNLPVEIKDDGSYWASYTQVNQLFADIVLGLSQPESTIWVHDYQLLLVPEMLRQERRHDLIGFFLHIPFPAAAKMSKLPHAKSLLEGLLGSDLIGFHTDVYVQDFLESCHQLNVGTPAPEQVIVGDRVVKVTDFPLGIDYDKFSRAGNHARVRSHVQELRKKHSGRKIILTVDRLDPTKGLVERLEAYQELLENSSKLHKKVVMVMLALPSRTEIEAYKQLKEKVEQLVEDINGLYGNRNWQPVHYRYQTVPFEELAAMYRVADVAFIAPIKDGMNLVAKEYVASRPDRKGVLILSETAGAAQELTDALLVNPHRPKSMVEGLTKALSMPTSELTKRASDMHKQLAGNTIHHWKRAFMGSLHNSGLQVKHRTKRLNENVLSQMLGQFAQASHPAILLDYDGVLTPFADRPDQAKPSDKILKLVADLAKRVNGEVLIISGRSKYDMQTWLGELPVTLAAEHGALTKSPGKSWRKSVDTKSDWKDLIRPVLQKYADKTPHAFVEEKNSSLVWHYRLSPPYYAQKYSTVLTRSLKPLLKPMGLDLYRGNMILEIKSPDANKGVVASKWLNNKHDFVLAIGDDYTDEDMFAAMPESAYTLKVGSGKTLARYRTKSVEEVHKVLKALVKAKKS